MSTLNRDAIKANGWALGRVFTSTSAPILVDLIPDNHKSKDTIYISVTHDCSIINPCLIKEPYVEYLSIRPIERSDGQFINARSIRRLHFQVEVNGKLTWFEASMALRGFINRHSLTECLPDTDYNLTDESQLVLKRWLSNRYLAQTFPDRFNELTARLVANSKAPLIKAFNRDVGKACNSIFLSLTPSDYDLPRGQDYEVILLLVYREAIVIDLGQEAIDDFAAEIEEILGAIEGLKPVKVFAMADSAISYDQIIKMTRWNLDYVSLKNDAEVLAVENI